jgi:DNA-binding NarL/FixJ family response regulator
MLNKLSNINKQSFSVIKILIVEDDRKIRDSYVQLINDTEDMVCVGSYESCEKMFKEIDHLGVDVILMDIGLPGMNGIEGIKKVKELYPSIEILMLTVYDDDEKIFNSIYAGASGYILKNVNPEELLKAIREIKIGAPMSAAIARRILNFVRGSKSSSHLEQFKLTDRELEILQLLMEGLSFKKIADKLFISSLTVHSHIKKIYEKLHVHSKAEAVATAFKNRII